MNADGLNKYNYLDIVRLNHGTDKCKTVFYEIYKKNAQKAITLLNGQRMTFPCLFILLPQIKSLRLYHHLNSRNIIAAEIVDQVLNPKDSNKRIHYLSSKNGAVHSALKWILETGNVEDSLSDDYRQVMDITISVLINTYEDNSVLPIVDDMIFKRSKKGYNIHDLVWAFFRIHHPCTLKLIAEHVRSSDRKEAELACHLLHLEVTDEMAETDNYHKKYNDYLQWLEENAPFLYFTVESFQFASKPMIYNIDLERKYIHKGTSSYTKRTITPSDSEENGI